MSDAEALDLERCTKVVRTHPIPSHPIPSPASRPAFPTRYEPFIHDSRGPGPGIEPRVRRPTDAGKARTGGGSHSESRAGATGRGIGAPD